MEYVGRGIALFCGKASIFIEIGGGLAIFPQAGDISLKSGIFLADISLAHSPTDRSKIGF